MPRTDNFRQQHSELTVLAGAIKQGLRKDSLARDASEMRRLLSEFAGKLKVHLAIEDKTLYPKLLNHGDPEIAATAQEFMDEMGGLAGVFNAYVAKWSTIANIQRDVDGFVKESQAIFSAFAARIHKEDNVLYKMLDDLA